MVWEADPASSNEVGARPGRYAEADAVVLPSRGSRSLVEAGFVFWHKPVAMNFGSSSRSVGGNEPGCPDPLHPWRDILETFRRGSSPLTSTCV